MSRRLATPSMMTMHNVCFRSRLRTSLLFVTTIVIAPFAMTSQLAAQCTTSWQPEDVGFGFDGSVYTTVQWDPDGGGPLMEVTVLGGEFSQAGSVLANNVAFVDVAGQSFSAPSSGPDGAVLALLDAGNGELIVAGQFQSAGGVPGTNNIARWDGTNWSSVGGGVDGKVAALQLLPNGILIAGGSFTSAGSASVAANNIAQWDGSTWQPLAQGITVSSGTAEVDTLAALPSGDLVVGGLFNIAGTTSAQSIARWDGLSWQAMQNGLSLSWVRTLQLLVRANGDLVAAGIDLGSSPVISWDGTTWAALPSTPSNIRSIGESSAGTLLASEAGIFFSGPKLYEFAANTWTTLAQSPLVGEYHVVTALPGGGANDLLVAGTFASIAGVDTSNLALRTGGVWVGQGATATGPDASVCCFATAPDGTVYAGGQFTQIDGTPLARIARWDGAAWQPLGSGMDNTVTAIGVARNGDVYAGGTFTIAGGVAAAGLAHWNGTDWAPVSGGPTDIQQIVRRRNGHLLLAGSNLAELTPTGLVQIPGATMLTGVAELPDGRIGATGAVQSWATPGSSQTAIWDGSSWQLLTNDHSAAHAIGHAPNGDLVLSASFLNGENIMSWDGSLWQPLGTGLDSTASALTNLPTGELVAGGPFLMSGSTSTPFVASFDGTSWQGLGGVSSEVIGLHFSPTGTLWASTLAPSATIARRATDCPPTIVNSASGCTGSTQPHLQATDWPFVGGTYRAHCTGVPLGLIVNAYSDVPTNVVLSNVLANGAPGCTLLGDPVVLETLLPVAGVASCQLAIPANISLAGLTIRHQMLPLEYNAPLITEISASNALSLTVGSF